MGPVGVDELFSSIEPFDAGAGSFCTHQKFMIARFGD